MKDLYLDANAHVPLNHKAAQAYIDFNTSKAGYGNPSSPSIPGREASAKLEDARCRIAECIGAKTPNQIIFTTSATQACQWAIEILSSNCEVIATSPVEHNAVRDAFNSISNNNDLILKTNNNGLVIDDRKLDGVTCIYVQNEIGIIQPIDKLNCSYIFSDMTQALGKMHVDVSALDIDIAAFGAHKFGGPVGVGFLYLKNTSDWFKFGTGSSYFMDYPGTPNVGGVVATAVALEDAIQTLQERTEKMFEFRMVLEDGLKELGFEIIGVEERRIPNTTFIKVPCDYKYDVNNCGLSLMMELGDFSVYGVHVGLGSACGSMYTGGSPLMKALGRISDSQEYIRLSQWGDYGKEEANFVLTRIQNASKTYG